MKKILLLKGLPGCGKSTFAKELIEKEPDRWKRVNKDDLRAMLDNGKHSKGNENFVLRLRDYIVATTIGYGKNIIVDDTNLNPRHLERMQEIVEDLKAKGTTDVEIEIKDFTDVPIEVCIERDLKRPNSVGEKVIRTMCNQYLRPKPTPPESVAYDPSLPDCILCDLDGSLALFGDANPYDRNFLEDTLNTSISHIFDWKDKAEYGLKGNRTSLILFSGRQEKFREQTEQWLRKNLVIYQALHMRKTNDARKDFIIKQELYEEHIKGEYNVVAVFDDRLQVCRLWHELGLPLFRVGDPDADF